MSSTIQASFQASKLTSKLTRVCSCIAWMHIHTGNVICCQPVGIALSRSHSLVLPRPATDRDSAKNVGILFESVLPSSVHPPPRPPPLLESCRPPSSWKDATRDGPSSHSLVVENCCWSVPFYVASLLDRRRFGKCYSRSPSTIVTFYPA